MNNELHSWLKHISEVHIPRWDELPDMDLYKDQVVTLVEKYVGDLFNDGEKFITPSMINNYVKWKMIKAPNKKKHYNREHVGYLIAISILKQVVNIKDIKSGIEYQSRVIGTHNAYNGFCEMLEMNIARLANLTDSSIPCSKRTTKLADDEIAMYMATTAFAARLITVKKVTMQNALLEMEEKVVSHE